MSNLHDLMKEAGSARGGAESFSSSYGRAVHGKIRRRRVARAAGLGSAAAVSAGAVALGVGQVATWNGGAAVESANPGSGADAPSVVTTSPDVEVSTSPDAAVSVEPAVTPSPVDDAPVPGPSPAAGATVDAFVGEDVPDGTIYAVQHHETGETVAWMTLGAEPGTAVLTRADGSEALVHATSAGTFVFFDESVGADGAWIEVDPEPADGAQNQVTVHYGDSHPGGEESVVEPLG
ncbi:hypothetical protein ON058_01960 [Demequina sp. B12]|uniref:hypothetical protein n=1 Tax=Demequina sp. B12 TaxID=2992757 RepID=UPI00237B3C77|nr:hypothetical protein [Demequina sp. B12]MDE0572176.1 hypothetical protein [Demequina sp. B12]